MCRSLLCLSAAQDPLSKNCPAMLVLAGVGLQQQCLGRSPWWLAQIGWHGPQAPHLLSAVLASLPSCSAGSAFRILLNPKPSAPWPMRAKTSSTCASQQYIVNRSSVVFLTSHR